ncbi:OLC1v1013247C1 [Oldenlandia corymbosa var. corymbosa]|uniref:OLC1v1013247C1 n=1 Tax=Oldenlandia corymbosa var. corymbosa TaxID=529605 RepID=A0AAV1DZV6_OLDCO|nr:OLC1v1013247C1 [Oldenlandia corymbosa var. corymbosa]
MIVYIKQILVQIAHLCCWRWCTDTLFPPESMADDGQQDVLEDEEAVSLLLHLRPKLDPPSPEFLDAALGFLPTVGSYDADDDNDEYLKMDEKIMGDIGLFGHIKGTYMDASAIKGSLLIKDDREFAFDRPARYTTLGSNRLLDGGVILLTLYVPIASEPGFLEDKMVVVNSPQFSAASTGRQTSPKDDETLAHFQWRHKRKRNDRRTRKENTPVKPTDQKGHHKVPDPYQKQRLAKLEAELKKLKDDNFSNQRKKRYILKEYQHCCLLGLPDPTNQDLDDLVEEKEARRTLDLLEIRRGKCPVPDEGEERSRKEIPYCEASRAKLSDTHGDTFWEVLKKTNPVEPPRGNVHSRLGPKAPPEKSLHDYRRGGDPPPRHQENQGNQDPSIRDSMRRMIGMIVDRSPFIPRIRDCSKPQDFDFPKDFACYTRDSDPQRFLNKYVQVMRIRNASLDFMAKALPSFFDGQARWFGQLPEGSIDSFEDLTVKLVTRFFLSMQVTKMSIDLSSIRQGHNESLSDFHRRFTRESLQVDNFDDRFVRNGFIEGLNP